MLAYYRRIGLTSRLIALLLIEALVFAIVLRNYPAETLLPALGITAAALVLLDLAIRRAPTVLAATVALGQVIVGTYGAVNIDLAAADLAGGAENGFIFYFLQAFVLFALSLHAAWAIFFASGRVWVNLLLASALLDFATVALIGFGVFPIVWAVPAALGASLIYLALRTIRFRKRVQPQLPRRSKATLDAARSALESRGLTLGDAQSTPGIDFIAHDGRAVFAVAALEAKGSVKLTGEGLIVDGEDLTEVLAEVTAAANRLARHARLPRQRVYPVLYTRKAGLNPALRSIRVRSRKAPDRSLGGAYLANEKGLQRLLRGTGSLKPMAQRYRRRLAKLLSN